MKVKTPPAPAPASGAARALARWRREELEAEAEGGRERRDVSGNSVLSRAETQGQEYLQRVLEALHSRGGPANGSTSAPVSLVREPPDDGYGLAPDLAKMYEAYVGQFL